MLGDLGNLIVAKGFEKLPKVQKIENYYVWVEPWSSGYGSRLISLRSWV